MTTEETIRAGTMVTLARSLGRRLPWAGQWQHAQRMARLASTAETSVATQLGLTTAGLRAWARNSAQVANLVNARLVALADHDMPYGDKP